MNDETDGIVAALGRLGTQVTMLAEHLGTRLGRSEAAQMQTRNELMAHMGRLRETMTEMRQDVLVNAGSSDQAWRAHDSRREKLRTLNETITFLIRRVWLLEADLRTLRSRH